MYEAKIKKPRVIVSAIITRADGTKEDMGVISDSKNDKFVKKLKKKVKEIFIKK